MRHTLVSSAADILTGMVAFALFVVADNYLRVGADLRLGLVVLAVLCLCAGLLRGRTHPGNAWWKGLLVSSGSSLVLLVWGWGSIQHVILAILLLVANLFAACGARVRHLWSAQSATQGGMMLLVPLVALAAVAMTTIPALTTRIATRRRIHLVHTGYEGSEHLQAELSSEIDTLLAERL